MSRPVLNNRRRAALIAVAALVGAAGLMTVAAVPASAAPATRYVASTGNDAANDCTVQASPCATIQHAVGQANANDTVNVAGGSIAYHEGVHIRKSLTLVGAGAVGAGRTTIDGPDECCAPSIYVDGFDTSSTPEVTIRDLDVSGNSGDAGILVNAAIAHVIDSVVTNNANEGIVIGGVQIDAHPAVAAVDTVIPSATITGSSISNNGGEAAGVGVQVNQGRADIDHSVLNANASGGIVVQSGTGHVETTTLNGNRGAGFVLDGSQAVGELLHSTISNTVPLAGEGAGEFGAGVIMFGGTMNIATSTIANNVGQGVLSFAANAHVDNSTISGTKPSQNTAPSAGVVVTNLAGLQRNAAKADRFAPHAGVPAGTKAKVSPSAAVQPSTTLRGTIDADNTTVADCIGLVNDGGYNLASDDTCGFDAPGSIQNGTAKLGALADNGGPTLTKEPKKGSDALDKIPTGKAGCDDQGTDQRGLPRLAGAKCDIGSVEVVQTAVVIAPAALPHGTVGQAYHQVVTATGGLGAPYLWSLAGGALPPGLTFSSAGVISGTPTQAGTFHFTVSVDDPTLKNYTIVIEEGAVAATSQPPLANTGPKVRPVAYLGGLAVGLGLLMLMMSGALGRWYRRYVRQH